MPSPKFSFFIIFGGAFFLPTPSQAIAPSLTSHFSIHLPSQTASFLSVSPQINPRPTPHIQAEAKAITVQIWSAKQFLGSGIIIEHQDHTDHYIILTSHHLIRWREPPYYIVTPDGTKYTANVLSSINWQGTDLRCLSITAPHKKYQVAQLGSSYNLVPGETVFAVGYPLQLRTADLSKIEPEPELSITGGFVSHLLENPLEEGYQLGYSNDVYKGMSGGPVLNQAGEVVAINGLHANPVWSFDKFYEDGSPVEPQLQEVIPQFSWGVPIEKVTGDRLSR